jgi:fructose-1,6-bisphosphatase/inositol monophosphatase family enzyme
LTTGYASNAVIGGEGCHWAGTNRYLQWIVDPLDIEGWGAKKVDRA